MNRELDFWAVLKASNCLRKQHCVLSPSFHSDTTIDLRPVLGNPDPRVSAVRELERRLYGVATVSESVFLALEDPASVALAEEISALCDAPFLWPAPGCVGPLPFTEEDKQFICFKRMVVLTAGIVFDANGWDKVIGGILGLNQHPISILLISLINLINYQPPPGVKIISLAVPPDGAINLWHFCSCPFCEEELEKELLR